MNSLMQWFRKLNLFIRRGQFDRELAEEMQFHREESARAFQADGMDSGDAQRAARKSFGNGTSMKEQSRDEITLGLETVLQDVRFALRQLRKNPAFALTAILILVLGIGASVTIFGFVDAALLRPLPYKQPSRLVALFESITLGPRFHLSYPDYLDWKKSNTVFSALDVYMPYGFLLTDKSGTVRVGGARVSDGFFKTLGVVPVLGRDFAAGEDLPSAQRVVLLSYSAWQKRYGGNPNVIGQTVILDGDVNTIVGVLPKDFHFAPAEPSDYWRPLQEASTCRGCHGYYGVARLKEGVSFASAVSEMILIAKRLEEQYPDSNRNQGAFLLPLTEVIMGDIRPILLVLLAGAGLLLLIASVNVSGLLLVRSESRQKEIAVRRSIGASRKRLLRQFITEGLVLAVAGSILGCIAAYWGMRVLTWMIPTDLLGTMPYLNGAQLSPRVALFALGISVFAGLLFSLTPIFRIPLSDLRAGLSEGSRGSANTVWRRFGSKFVVVELAMAVVLLVGAGLLGKSFYRLLQVNPGLNPEHVATLKVEAAGSAYEKPEQQDALAKRILEAMRALPGVQSVGLTNKLPIGDGDNTTQFRVVGRPFHGESNEVARRVVSTAYFSTLGARLLRGRYFIESDDSKHPQVLIINQALATQYFPGEDALGRELIYNTNDPVPHMTIVGIIDDMKEGALDLPARATMYVPLNANTDNSLNVVVRTTQEDKSILHAMNQAVRGIDPSIAISEQTTMLDRIHDAPSTYIHRASAWLVGSFAFVALILGVVGLYGVISYSVSQRSREIGVRMAMGASRSTVYELILKEAGRLAAIGIALGLVCALLASTLMRSLLFSVQSWDIPTLAAVALILAACAMLAAFMPARKAASLDVVEILRAE